MIGDKIESFEDLEVYQRLCQLHLEISQISLNFPKFELHESGSQIRRSSNGIPANIAKGWNNRHINIYPAPSRIPHSSAAGMNPALY